MPAALAGSAEEAARRPRGQGSRSLIEVLDWDDELRGLARGLRPELPAGAEQPERATRVGAACHGHPDVRVGTAADEVHGLVLLPTHPLRLAWIAAYDQFLRGWAQEVATGGKVKAAGSQLHRHHHGVPAIAGQPAIHDGRQPTARRCLRRGADVRRGALPSRTRRNRSPPPTSFARRSTSPATAPTSRSPPSALGDRIYSYRNAHPGTGTLRVMAINPGSGTVVRRALEAAGLGACVGQRRHGGADR